LGKERCRISSFSVSLTRFSNRCGIGILSIRSRSPWPKKSALVREAVTTNKRRVAGHDSESHHATPRVDRDGAPVSLDAEAVRRRKGEVFARHSALRLDAHGDVARAQYDLRHDGREARERLSPGRGDQPQSATETYAAIRLSINNWRWQGVPFYLRSGKRLARRVSEIAIQFKRRRALSIQGHCSSPRRLNLESQRVRRQIETIASANKRAGRAFELNRDLRNPTCQPLARTKIKGHALPSPVVDRKPNCRVGLSRGLRVDPLFLEIAFTSFPPIMPESYCAASDVAMGIQT